MLLKKLLLFGTLLCVTALLCMEPRLKHGRIDPQAPEYAIDDQVTIQTRDGQDFRIDVSLAKLSLTLTHLIEDAGIDAPLPLPSVAGSTWAEIQRLLPSVKSIKDKSHDSAQQKDAIIAALTALSGEKFIDIISATNYLDIPILLSLALDVAKEIDVKKINSAQIAALPKEIRNPIIAGKVFDRLGVQSDNLIGELKGHHDVGHHDVFRSVCVTPDGSKIVSGSDDDRVRVWDIATGKQIHELTQGVGPVWSVAATPDGTKIVSGFDDGAIRVWDINTGKLLQVLKGKDGISVESVCVTPDGSKIVSCSWGDVQVWDISTGKQLAELLKLENIVWSVCVTPDSSKIVSGSADGTIEVWNMITGKQIYALSGHTATVLSVCVTPDGTKIVSGSADNTIRIWDINTGKLLQELKGHAGRVFAVCVTPDGSKIISGSEDKTIRIWDISTSKQFVELLGHASDVTSVCVTPDGTKIVSGSDDETIRIWDISIFNQLRVMNLEQAQAIWAFLQTGQPVGWRKIMTLLGLSTAALPGVPGTRTVPPLMPLPVLPQAPRGTEGEAALKKHKPGE